MQPSYRSAGWTAIASGVIGFLAYGFLMGYIMVRNQNVQTAMFIIKFHDVGVILQFVLLIPVAFGLHKLSRQRSPGMSRAMLVTGVGTLSFTILFVLLGFPKILNDVLYMFPQGLFGVWLMVVCWGMPGILSKGLRWFGMVVGLGLALVGTFPLGYAIFVDTIIRQILFTKLSDEELIKLSKIPANKVLHLILWIGSFMGVATLPIWTILLGWRLLRNRSSIPDTPAPILD